MSRPSPLCANTSEGTSAGLFPTFRATGPWLLRLPGRLWRKAWRYLLGLLALLILAHLVLNIVAGRRLEAELARLRAEGAPLTLEEAAPPKTLESEHAAALYEQAFQGLDNLDDVTLVRDFLGRGQERPTVDQVATMLARHAADFRLLEQASQAPAVHFPVNWEAGAGALFPHLGKVRDATRFLVAKAVVDAHYGRTGEALNNLGIAIRMSDQISAEPTLVPQLVRISCMAIVANKLPDVLAGQATAAQCHAFYEELREVDIMGPWAHGLAGERALGLWDFQYVRRASSHEFRSLLSLSMYGSDTDKSFIEEFAARPPGWAVALARAAWAPFLKLDEVYYLHQMRRVITLAKKPYRERADLQKREDWRDVPRYAVLTTILIPVLSLATQARDKGIAAIGLMQAAMALRAYQIEHGEYPESLAELRAAGGWPIPDDPFSGKPFIYRREGKGYLIYSVGPDFSDDGGIDVATAREKAPKGFLGRPNYDLPLRMTR